MSNAVSALQGASYAGFVEITETGLQGMISLRGDLSDASFAKTVARVTGVKMPGVTGFTASGSTRLGWMSPDALLVLCPYDEAAGLVARLSEALDGSHFLAANMSDARAVFEVKGAGCRNVISKLAPVDMSPERFKEGVLRRSRLAQAPAGIWLDGPDILRVMCFRSQADYVFALLSRAAMPGCEL